MNQTKTTKKSGGIIIAFIVIPVCALFITAVVLFTKQPTTELSVKTTKLSQNGNLVIPINEVSEKAHFYPIAVDGTQLEIIAVKATDGSIRTAFNTCQVCFDSGKGYYKQEGNQLVCQNCGNRFTMNQVQVTKGGCNPVPISTEEKTEDATNITISNEFLLEAKEIFQNWKS